MSALTSNTLSDRAETVRQLIAESDAAAVTSIEKALAAGHELVAAKAECRHGEWLPFLERAGLKARKAQQYMQLAESGLKSATVAHLGGIRGALEFLAKREMASKIMQAIAEAEPPANASLEMRVERFAEQLDLSCDLVAATQAMYECFSHEAREEAEAQRVDAVSDASDWGRILGDNIQRLALEGASTEARNAFAVASFSHLEEHPTAGRALIALNALLATQRAGETSSIDGHLSAASNGAVNAILRAAA